MNLATSSSSRTAARALSHLAHGPCFRPSAGVAVGRAALASPSLLRGSASCLALGTGGYSQRVHVAFTCHRICSGGRGPPRQRPVQVKDEAAIRGLREEVNQRTNLLRVVGQGARRQDLRERVAVEGG